MANAKPTSTPAWTIGNPDFNDVTVEPDGSKKLTGWLSQEKPPFQWMNWLFWNITQWILYFNDPLVSVDTVTVAQSPYTMLTTARNIQVNTSAGPISMTLPAPTQGLLFNVKDVGGLLGTNQVTLVRNAGPNTFEGVAADYTLNSNFGSWTFRADGTGWWLI